MQNKKSSIIKDACALFLITLVAALSLGFVNEITLEPIAAQKAKAKSEAYQAVYSEAALVDTANAEISEKVASSEEYMKSNGFAGVRIDEAGIAKDAGGKAIGYVMTVTTKEGYGGEITFTAGYKADGTLTAIEMIAISETVGLGMNATEDSFKGQFSDKKVDAFEVTKKGAANENEINAISGATITSEAVTNAVNAAVSFAGELLANGIGGVAHE